MTLVDSKLGVPQGIHVADHNVQNVHTRWSTCASSENTCDAQGTTHQSCQNSLPTPHRSTSVLLLLTSIASSWWW